MSGESSGKYASLGEEEILAIGERCERSTPGPWKSLVESRDHISGSDFIMTGGKDIYLTGATVADQDFVAHARQDVPRLIAEIRRLQNLLRKQK